VTLIRKSAEHCHVGQRQCSVSQEFLSALDARVGSVLPLEEARTAHEMLAGAPHKPGKILLRVAAPD
jgi:hypothetical protein